MVPAHVIPTLAGDADAAIRHALAHGAPGFVAAPKSEVDFVAAVVLGATKDIASRWSAHLKPLGISISITGVFCHASPQVDFPYPGTTWPGATKTRELGDLLVVHDDVSSGTKTDRVAVLVQAKRSASGTVSSPDAEQLHLYRYWPPFQATHATFPPGRRDFATARTAGAKIDSGRYGIIHDPRGAPPDWLVVAPTAPPLRHSTGTPLGSFMAEMLGASGSGSGREALVGGGDDWSQTVEDLLNVTGVRHFAHAASLGPGVTAPRGATAIAMIVVGTHLSQPVSSLGFSGFGAGSPPPGEGEFPRWGAEEGINTIYMRTTSREGDL
jgi:hypothetical protein